MKWTDHKRTDLRSIPKMERNHWEPVFSDVDKRHNRITPDHPPIASVGFKKNGVHVWKVIRYGVESWKVADLIDGYFCNHRDISYLSELLDPFLTEEE